MILGCLCGGTLEMIAAIGIPSLLGVTAWLLDHITTTSGTNERNCTIQSPTNIGDNANVGIDTIRRRSGRT